MSDVGVAPAPAPAAAQSEVPINPDPVNTPAPVTNQPPEKQPVDMKDADPRRESNRKAIERAKARDQNHKGEPRKAKMGDNQPPEETKAEREKPEKIDLKKRPDEQPRDRGRFAPKERQGETHTTHMRPDAAKSAPNATQSAPAVYKQLPENDPYREPLRRMTEHAKAD